MRRAIVTLCLLSACLFATGACRQSSDSSPPAPGTAAGGRLPTCAGDRLRLAVVMTGSTMSQPFADIAVTSTGTTACTLEGYPRVTAWGRGAATGAPSARLDLHVRHTVYERVDHGPRVVVISPERAAYFSVGTATAYQGGLHLISVTRLSVTLPGTHSPSVLPVSLLASRPAGGRIPVGVTAVWRSQN